MRRREFMAGFGSAALLCGKQAFAHPLRPIASDAKPSSLSTSVVGQPADLARFGELKSWLSPEASPLIQKGLGLRAATGNVLRLAEMPWKASQFDVGVEWPEFRTVHKVVIRFLGEDKAPKAGKQFLEYWVGPSVRQGGWRPLETLENDEILGTPLRIDGRTWAFPFSSRRTCKLRLRLQDEKQVEIESFEVYGSSRWGVGDITIEWGHWDGDKSYDGSLEVYNGEVVEVFPWGGTQLRTPFSWVSNAGNGKLSGITTKVLYTRGMDVDRTILTVRTKSRDFSFLPIEAIDDQPIDIPDFGVYIRSTGSPLKQSSYRQQNSGRSRIIGAVTRHPEQTMENAYQQIRSERVTLSFVGFDANHQKFGIGPNGHLLVGNNDPSFGQPMRIKFAVYFDSTAAPTSFEEPPGTMEVNFSNVANKQQELEEGWLPAIISKWSQNYLSFERTDYAVLPEAPEALDGSKLTGTDYSVMISRLKIRNDSPVVNTAGYYIKPWKPAVWHFEYGPMLADIKSIWELTLRENGALALEGGHEYAVCYVDTHGLGSLSLDTAINAMRYSVVVNPGQEVVLHIVIPGQPLPGTELARLRGLSYDRLHDATMEYWKARLGEGMQVEIPDPHLQNLYKASLHHFFLAFTRDVKRNEFYPNVAVLDYGCIGSESSPIIQSLDMRGLHQRAEGSLQSWLSTQGDSMPAGDYVSKEGGFYHFWPNYTINQGSVLWALAEHYLYTRDQTWLRKVAPQIVAGCDFILRERKRTMNDQPMEPKPLTYGLAPAGCVVDMQDWQYTFMLNGYFYLGLKKSAQVLQDVDPENAGRIATEANDYLQAIHRALKESIAISPVSRLRDNTSVPAVPPYVGLRGFRYEVKDVVDLGYGEGSVYDTTAGSLHLLKAEVLKPTDPEVDWLLNVYEDRFFMNSPVSSPVRLNELSTDWFDLGGFEKLQPYYVHYPEAYLQRDQIENYLRAFFNTLASISDPQTLTFRESLIYFSGSEPNKTHEEGWFFHQLRFMLVMEMGGDLFLARGTPREWLEHGRTIAVTQAPTYFGELSYRIQSFSNEGRIEAAVTSPSRERLTNLHLRLRHPTHALLKRVTINGHQWSNFEAAKEWIILPTEPREAKVVAYY